MEVPSEKQIEAWIEQMRSPFAWVRHAAIGELEQLDFEAFERPPQFSILLASLAFNKLELKAKDSLTRVLNGMEDAAMVRLGPDERGVLRAALLAGSPHKHADFLIAVIRVLFHLQDTAALPNLMQLVDRSFVRITWAKRAQGTHGPVREVMVSSFNGTRDEKNEMRRVHTAANAACERLKLIAEQQEREPTLLRPAMRPESEELLRPAGPDETPSELLLRPARDPNVD